jgi:hypothetical protein
LSWHTRLATEKVAALVLSMYVVLRLVEAYT